MFKELNHRAYEVGGSIRNELLGRPPNDIDFVIETNEEEFENIFPNAKRVGNTFPVYLIEDFEVALTRTEKSTGKKYQDFEIEKVGVSINEDLARRDFTINSIARNFTTNMVVDPFNGINDIKARNLRTINDNFVIDDPLRVYRLARFASEFDFNIDKHTADIVRRDQKYIKNVNTERIYLELKKNYERSNQPSIFFRVLYHLDVLKYHFPYFNVASTIPAGPAKYHSNKSVFDHLLDAFDNAKSKGHTFDVAIASLHHDLGKILTDRKTLPHHYGHENRGIDLVNWIEKHHRFTAKQIELMKISGKQHMRFHVLEKTKSPIKLVRFYKNIKKYFMEVIQVADNDHELNETQLKILKNLHKAFQETEIIIPDIIIKKGKEAIVAYVEQQYANTFKGINR